MVADAELPKVLIDLLGRVPFHGGGMPADLQEQQRTGIMYTPHICGVPVALLRCILAAVLVRGRRQQDLDHFGTLFVPVMARVFKSVVHEALLFVAYLEPDEEDEHSWDAHKEPEGLTVPFEVIGEACLQFTSITVSRKHSCTFWSCVAPYQA